MGKRANGAGTIMSSWNQDNWANASSVAANMSIDAYAGFVDGSLFTSSGGATGYQHRIVGSGTRFASQFGAGDAGTGVLGLQNNFSSSGDYNEGPYLSVQLNGDWETQRVVLLGLPNVAGAAAATDGYDEYFAVLENSFSEPLLKATPWAWNSMLSMGTGNVRSYGKRLVSEEWSTIEPWYGVDPRTPGAQYSSLGLAGNSRFLTQLRTGFTVTACGQTRTVNSISSDVELTLDRPFTLGNREYFPVATANTTAVPASGGAAARALSVRGLTRTLPLWPRGVTVQVIVTQGGNASVAQFKLNVWWKTFIRTDDGDGNAQDDVCPGYLPGNGTATANGGVNLLGNATGCGTTYRMSAYTNSWFTVNDPQLGTSLEVYLKWNASANYTTGDQWRLHVGDIQNCPWFFSREGERFLNDDNANPPVCYNHGKCLSISTGAQSAADGALRPNATGTGLLASFAAGTAGITPAPTGAVGGTVTSTTDGTGMGSTFTTSLSAGDVVRVAMPGAGSAWGEEKYLDMRVSAVLSDTQFVTDSMQLAGAPNSPLITNAFFGTGLSYYVMKCAAGRRFDSPTLGPHALLQDSGSSTAENSRGLVGDSTGGAYLPHPSLSFYQTWSYRYCEIDPGCCGFQVASVVAPQAFAYYSVKPDHGNYNLRMAVFTVNDNLDLYTRRADRGAGRPDASSYDSTSVRESVPWAIDEDASGFACSGGLGVNALGVTLTNATALGSAPSVGASGSTAYATALGYPSVSASAPDCVPWTIGVMGDNKYPQTVGASEYSARFFLDFNYDGFACPDSGAAEDDSGLIGDPARRSRCIESGLRFVRDATVVESATAQALGGDGAPALPSAAGTNSSWVVRLTESQRRSGLAFTPWTATQLPSYPTAQRSGAVWWKRKLNLLDGFETNFVFQVADPSQCGGDDKICDGGDGFALVMTNDARQETASARFNDGWDCYPSGMLNPDGTADTGRNGCDPASFGATAPASGAYPAGLIGCPADGLGYGNSKKSSTVNYFGAWQECSLGLRKSLAVEFDLFYNVERRDPKQGVQHWWINATEYVSYNDNHLGVFSTTDPFYASQPWGAAQPSLMALHSDDENGAHYGSTPSVLTMADFQQHTVKVRYTRGFTTEKQGSGRVRTTDVTSGDGRRLLGDANSRFKSELRTGFEFGYADRVKANVRVKLYRDASNSSAQGPPLPGALFGDDGIAVRVLEVLDDSNANLELTALAGATAAEADARVVLQPAWGVEQGVWSDYWIIKEFPGEIQVFIDDMDRYAFQVAVEDRDMAKVLDGDGNAYLGLTASTGSRGFSLPGYDPLEIQETHDLLAWNFCSRYASFCGRRFALNADAPSLLRAQAWMRAVLGCLCVLYESERSVSDAGRSLPRRRFLGRPWLAHARV